MVELATTTSHPYRRQDIRNLLDESVSVDAKVMRRTAPATNGAKKQSQEDCQLPRCFFWVPNQQTVRAL